MQLTVYVDVLFFLNLIIDGVLLVITTLLCGLRLRPLRLFFAALFGALYSVFCLYFPVLEHGLFAIFSSGLMVFLSCRAKTMRILFRQLAVFYLVSFTLCGLCFFVFWLGGTNQNGRALLTGGALFLDFSSALLFFLSGALFFLLRLVFASAKKSCRIRSCLEHITLSYGANSIQLCALCDTGNFLSDPKTGLGVCVADWDAVSPLFPNCDTTDAAVFSAENIRFFPCAGIGGKKTLPAFLMAVSKTNEKQSSTRWVAVTNTVLDRNSRYHLLLPNDFEGAN